MLSEIGSIASVVGVLVSLLGLGFALLQLRKLRGETRAASEASEETRRLLRRDLAGTDLTRLSERIQRLIEIHRTGNIERSLDHYREIVGLLQDIRQQHPHLSDEHRLKIQGALATLGTMQSELEACEGNPTPEMISGFNSFLRELQATLLLELEDYLEDFDTR